MGTVLSMGTDGQKFADIREASRRGTLPGADVYTAGIGFGAKDGVPPRAWVLLTSFAPHLLTKPERRSMSRPAETDSIEIWVDELLRTYPKMPPEIYQAIIDGAQNGLAPPSPISATPMMLSRPPTAWMLSPTAFGTGKSINALLSAMKNVMLALHLNVCLDDFAFAYGDSPAWISDPFSSCSGSWRLLDMITSSEYKAKTRANEVAVLETAALRLR